MAGRQDAPSVRAQLEAGQAHYRAGRFEEAEAAYLEVLALGPQNPAVLERLGTVALWRNDAAQAVAYLEAALRHTPWYASFWPLNLNLKYRLGQPTCARTASRNSHSSTARQADGAL